MSVKPGTETQALWQDYRRTRDQALRDFLGGFDFRGDEPDGVDFLYQSFAVGASFSVSDVAASSRPMRRAILLHSLASFAYNTVLIAIAVNAALTFVG